MKDLNNLSKFDLIRVLWYVRYKWVMNKVRVFGRKFFPLDPMFYKKTA
jgi:hypothetical protein